MLDALDRLPVATLLAVIFAIVGGIAVVGDDLPFREYLESMAVMVGLLGIGRGVAARKTAR